MLNLGMLMILSFDVVHIDLLYVLPSLFCLSLCCYLFRCSSEFCLDVISTDFSESHCRNSLPTPQLSIPPHLTNSKKFPSQPPTNHGPNRSAPHSLISPPVCVPGKPRQLRDHANWHPNRSWQPTIPSDARHPIHLRLGKKTAKCCCCCSYFWNIHRKQARMERGQRW